MNFLHPSQNQPKADGGYWTRAIERLSTPQGIEAFRESCPFQVVSHTVMGFAFGGLLGLFLAGMSTSSPEFQISNPNALPVPTPALSTSAQARLILRDTATRTFRSARSFAYIGFLFSTFECFIESYRARHDLANTITAGCGTGATLAAKSGPKAIAMGCAGFAAFSTAIEYFMQEHD